MEGQKSSFYRYVVGQQLLKKFVKNAGGLMAKTTKTENYSNSLLPGR